MPAVPFGCDRIGFDFAQRKPLSRSGIAKIACSPCCMCVRVSQGEQSRIRRPSTLQRCIRRSTWGESDGLGSSETAPTQRICVGETTRNTLPYKQRLRHHPHASAYGRREGVCGCCDYERWPNELRALWGCQVGTDRETRSRIATNNPPNLCIYVDLALWCRNPTIFVTISLRSHAQHLV